MLALGHFRDKSAAASTPVRLGGYAEMGTSKSETGKRKPSPLRGLLVGIVILLLIPGTRDVVIDLAINVGWVILAISFFALIVIAMFKPR
ncbi:hypothetical protein ACGF3C_15610 [Micromonospora sp. NPDC047762]|uniref:hypothetical protein n=1 Tax=Micromonospora sp. NPDC047762 TaxID=3364255 RepID=UPI00371B568A